MPALALAEVVRVKVVRIVGGGGDLRAIQKRVFRDRVAVIESDQVDLSKTHEVGELHAQIRDRAPNPEVLRGVPREMRETGVLPVIKAHIGPDIVVAIGEAVLEIVTENPLRSAQLIDVLDPILCEELVFNHVIRGLEAHFFEEVENSVHAERDLVGEQGEVQLLQARSVSEDEPALPRVAIPEGLQRLARPLRSRIHQNPLAASIRPPDRAGGLRCPHPPVAPSL